MKNRTKGLIIAMSAALLAGTSAVSVFAGSSDLKFTASTSGSGNKITVRSVELDTDNDSYKNEIELGFGTRVSFKSSAKVSSITDSQGVSYTGKITDKDSDECDININGLKRGRTYTIKITGIKKAGTSSYRTLTVKATVPAASQTLKVKEVSCDINDDEKDSVSFEFNKNVSFKSGAYVIIKDSAGKQITTKNSYLDRDSDEVEVDVNASLREGKKYTYSIVGVRAGGTTAYKTLTGSFTAYED